MIRLNNYSIHGVYTKSYNWGAHIVESLMSIVGKPKISGWRGETRCWMVEDTWCIYGKTCGRCKKYNYWWRWDTRIDRKGEKSWKELPKSIMKEILLPYTSILQKPFGIVLAKLQKKGKGIEDFSGENKWWKHWSWLKLPLRDGVHHQIGTGGKDTNITKEKTMDLLINSWSFIDIIIYIFHHCYIAVEK